MRTRISVFLITLSGLILEVGLTRIYSASIWYHFAFVAISVALLGWGLGGFTVHLWKGVRGRENGDGARAARADENLIENAAVSYAPSPNLSQRERNQEADGRRPEAGQTERTAGGSPAYPLSMNVAAVVTLLYAGAIPLCLWLLVRYPFDMDRLPLYFLAPLLPFFLAGMALSIVFDIHRAVAGSLYFYDLIGAALGAVLVTLLLHSLGGEAALLAGSAAPFVAAFLMTLSPALRAQENKERTSGAKPSPYPLPEGEGYLSPTSRAEENKKELSGVRPSPNPLPEGEGSKNNASDPGASLRSAPGYSLSRLQREEKGSDADISGERSPNTLPEEKSKALSPASRAQEINNDADPGVAPSGLTPGYSLSRFQREDGPAERAEENLGHEVERARPSPNTVPEREGYLSPASRPEENKNNMTDPGASLHSAPGYSLSRLQREEKGSDADISGERSPNTLPEEKSKALSPASRAQEINNDANPGVAPSGRTPGYSLSRFQREDGPAERAEENLGDEVERAKPSPNPLPEREGYLSPAARAQENEGETGQPAKLRTFTPTLSQGGRETGSTRSSARLAGRAVTVGLAPRNGSSGVLPRVVQVTAALGVVLAIVGVVYAVKYGAFRVKPGTTKAMRNQMDASPASRIVQTGWNAYSRIDCVEGLPDSFARLYIDSDAWTGIRGWDGKLESAQDMKWSYRALPFRLTPNAETLIIGPGGGPDVVAALASGSKKVTAVEMNPLMLKFVRSYGARAGNLYDRPDVETVLSEGRNFISRTDRKFDIILLGFVDSWASVASGGLSLSENYLYTAEAMRAYYDHLKPDGILVILRWEMDIPRLTSNAVATLGASEAAKRVVVLMEKQAAPNDYSQMLFMLRKEPFSNDQMKEMREQWTQANAIIMPDGTAPPGIKEVLAGMKTLEQYEAGSPRFVGPVWDDSPFYFAIDRPWRMPGTIAERILKWLLAPSIGMLALFAVFGAPWRKRMEGEARERPAYPAYVGSLVYFAALGFGFIAVELALLQHLTLLVGHPIYTLSVLLFTLLAFGGIGASLSARWSMWKACAAVAIIGAFEALALPKLVPALLWLPLWGRIAVAIILIAPLGLAMGMPFPRGLKQTGEGSLPAPPFYWGLNGIMSVIGSVTTVFVALIWGFQVAMLMGSACYVLAALASVKAFPIAVKP